jgi:RNA polymerase sigma-70 factor (ECF subfamily)
MFEATQDNLPDTAYDAGVGNEYDDKLAKLFFAEALSRLSERQRQIMQLVFYHDLSLNESAEVLRLSPGSVRKYYDRAKKTLAEWFEKKGISKL